MADQNERGWYFSSERYRRCFIGTDWCCTNRCSMLAPHLAVRLKNKYPDLPVIHTTIDPQKQQKVMAMTENYSHRLHNFRIYNAAVMVVNNRTYAVEAYAGSADFKDAAHGGQVDGITAVRSPGSTLKPLVYAIAFDQGLLTPKRVISDVPVNFGGYAPENFNSKFNGNVTVETALMNSLNVPAVKALHLIGLQTMIDKLKEANFEQTRKSEKSLGLSLVLGGCGVKLERNERTVCCFANEGRYGFFALSEKMKTPHSLLNWFLLPPHTWSRKYYHRWIALNFLHIFRRIQFTFQESHGKPELPMDDVMHGVSDTIKLYDRCVDWELQRRGVPELNGAEMATPLLFELFNTIDYNSRNGWYVQPEALDFRLVLYRIGKKSHLRNVIIQWLIILPEYLPSKHANM